MKVNTLQKELGNIQSSLDYFLMSNIPKDAKILDIGCNYGSLIYNLYKLGYKNIKGVDVNKESIKKGKTEYKEISKNISYYNGNKIPVKDESFDVVLMFDVIEHISSIQKFLKNEVYRVLKKEGRFIFQTPNKLTNIPWEILQSKSFTKWKKYHCSLQTYSSLKQLLKYLGFRDIKIEKYNILTEHNKDKIRSKFGFFGGVLLNLVSLMPLRFQSNFFGSAIK